MFNNLRELITSMPDEKSCREYFAKQRWPDGVAVCPYCGCRKAYVIEGGKRYKCGNSECYKKFSVTVGTVFEASNIGLTKWFMAVYLCTAHKKGISSYQLAKDIGVSQKCAWFMLHRIRELMKVKQPVTFTDTVEADETYMARKYRSDYKGLPESEIDYKLNSSGNNKGAVLGLGERHTGKVKVFAFESNTTKHIHPTIRENVEAGSNLHTDESKLYTLLEGEYNRETVLHRSREWVRRTGLTYVSTNRVENFWSVMRRGVYGIYHQISYKHLQRYCDEFAFRYNSRELKDANRFTISLQQTEGRLDWKTLVGKK